MNTSIQNAEVALRVRRASRFFQRAKGLLFTKKYPEEFDGLFIVPCSSVHTLGMKYGIDLVFIDRGLRVIKVKRSVKPGRPFVSCRGAYGVLELRENAAAFISIGQQIHVHYVEN